MNGRGSQATELGALEVCLIHSLESKPINRELKEGVTDTRVFMLSLKMV